MRGVVVEARAPRARRRGARGSRRGPARRSATVRPSVKTIAWAPEQGSVSTRPKASRLRPWPTGTMTPVCHQSSWPISPGGRRALEGPGREEGRTHPGEVLLEDADATPIARAAQALEDDGGRGHRPRCRASRRSRRRRGRERTPGCPLSTAAAPSNPTAGSTVVAAHAEPSGDGALGQALAMEQSTGPRPSPPLDTLLPPSVPALPCRPEGAL